MYKGIGDAFAKTNQLAGGATAQRGIFLALYSFSLTQESETIEALAFNSLGVQTTKASAEKSRTTTLTLETQFVDWQQLGFYLGEFPKDVASATMPVVTYATVPSTGPYEIADASVTAGNTNHIFVSIVEAGTWGQPGHLPRATTPATPAAREVGVDTTNNKLIFNSAQAGAKIAYTTPVTYTNKQGYGGSGSTTQYGEISFYGKLFNVPGTNGHFIYIPSATIQSSPSIEMSGDVPTLSAEFRCNTPSGWAQPWQILNLDY